MRRETDLEVLRGRLRTVEGQVALATIVLVLTEPTAPTPQPAVDLFQTGHAGQDGGLGCPGNERLTIDEDEPMTVCYSLTNTGDTALGDIEVRDPGLDAAFKDLMVVEGDIEAPLPPNARLILAFETTARANSFVAPDVTASALNAAGEPTRRRVDVVIETVALDIVEDTSLPGFTDAMGAAWDALQRIFGVVVLVAGALVPFLWVPLLVLLVVWLRRRRMAQAAPAEASQGRTDGDDDRPDDDADDGAEAEEAAAKAEEDDG